MKKAIMMMILAFSILILFGKCKKEDDIKVETGSFSDPRDGQTYKWVKIGNQVWMAENLKYLPTVSADNGSFTEPHFYVYDYNGTDVNAAKATSNYQNYGVLYNWPALLSACPPGWHVASDAEWTKLVDYLVGHGFPNNSAATNGAGNALKSCRQDGSPLGGYCNTFEHPRWDASLDASKHHGFDAFSFAALPGGNRLTILNFRGVFYNIGVRGHWWTSTEDSDFTALKRHIQCSFSNISNSWVDDKVQGYSARCIKD